MVNGHDPTGLWAAEPDGSLDKDMGGAILDTCK
jgi:hypothetical protein